MLFSADFETTTDPNDCRVWAWGLCEIGNPDNFIHGTDIDGMFNWILSNEPKTTLYFHNLKFDGEFIFVWLFSNGFKYVKSRKELENNTFCSLISDKGQFYSIEICISKSQRKRIKIFDSLKILPFSVEQVAKSFGLPLSKLELDYDKKRPVGYQLLPYEIEYLKHDVEIMSRALKIMFDQNMVQMTQGSNALADYKSIVGKYFDKWFPVPEYDSDIRHSYKGGYVYLNKKYKNRPVGKGIVLDVNSLYPWAMYYCDLPYGEGVYFSGEYKQDEHYNLYVQHFSCQFELKQGMLPTIQLKNNLAFIPTEYIESSNNEWIDMCLTSVDLKLFFEHYDVYNVEYIDGWKFKSSNTMFRAYIDKWMQVKIESTKNGNKGMRTLAKLMLNALYGKFALNPRVRSKHPKFDNGKIVYELGEQEYRNPIYIPVGTFITAWARDKTIRSAQTCYDRFIYADTDSLHLYGLDIPDGIEVDPTKLGAWKHESSFVLGRYVRAKTYLERELILGYGHYKYVDGNKTKRTLKRSPIAILKSTDHKRIKIDRLIMRDKITCAGLPERCYPQVTWENFKIGKAYNGKLTFSHVNGGVVLKEVDFTIKG